MLDTFTTAGWVCMIHSAKIRALRSSAGPLASPSTRAAMDRKQPRISPAYGRVRRAHLRAYRGRAGGGLPRLGRDGTAAFHGSSHVLFSLPLDQLRQHGGFFPSGQLVWVVAGPVRFHDAQHLPHYGRRTRELVRRRVPTLGHWCMDPSTSSRVPDPHGSASDGDRLGGADHAVEHLDSEGDLAVLSGPAAGTELGPDQVLVAAHGGFGLIALAVLGRPLPADAVPFGQELDMMVARALPIRITCAQPASARGGMTTSIGNPGYRAAAAW